MEFKMERQGLVNIGDVVDVTEREGFNYSYIIEPAVAMSGCYKAKAAISVHEWSYRLNKTKKENMNESGK